MSENVRSWNRMSTYDQACPRGLHGKADEDR